MTNRSRKQGEVARKSGGGRGVMPADDDDGMGDLGRPAPVVDHRYPTRTGMIVKHLIDKAYGFVQDDADKAEYFYHRSIIQPPLIFEELIVGDRVTFTYHNSPKGLRCVTLVRVDG